MPFVLSVVLPDGKQENHLLKAGETTFGRKGADICFEEKSVSRAHAKIVVDPLDDSSQPSARPKITLIDSSKFGSFVFREAEAERVPAGERRLLAFAFDNKNEQLPSALGLSLKPQPLLATSPHSTGPEGVELKELMRIRLGLTAPLMELKWTPLVLCTAALSASSHPDGFDAAARSLTAHLVARYHQRTTHLVCVSPSPPRRLGPLRLQPAATHVQ